MQIIQRLNKFTPKSKTVLEIYEGCCPVCGCLLVMAEASFYCPNCGFCQLDFCLEREGE